jgi:hypothetical protein
MPMGNAFPARNADGDLVTVHGQFTGGGAAANCTKTSGAINTGISSVNYNAATGKYLVTFQDVGQQLVEFRACVGRADAAVPLFVIPIHGSLSLTSKTLPINVRTEAALTDLATTDKLFITAVWARKGPNS